jgi:ribonucleoside-diphosphate reductase alpha chain
MPTNNSSRRVKRGMSITRRFTTAGADPFDGIEFVRRRSAINNADGSTLFAMDDVEVPAAWEQVAVDILVSKFFRKAGVPQFDADGNQLFDDGKAVLGPERSAKQWALRLANAWKTWGERGGYFATGADADAYRDEMAHMLITQMGSPNSPQHFNTGLFEAYGIVADPEGNWYVDPATGESKLSAHRYERSAVNACFIQAVPDELVGDESIFGFIQNEARLFKAGSGSGANLSYIRAKNERLSGGGTASGVMSFARVADRAAGAIKSGGTTRRAAKMVILDVDHPEVLDFIDSKVNEERKVAALVAGGYSSDWNGEAYDTVAFQNGNNSIRVLAGFMKAQRDDADWELKGRVDQSVNRILKARDIWDRIVGAAWSCADPGVQYDDLLNDWNTAADTERLRGTNPCSEYTHVDDTACNLASLNLVKFFNDDAQTFDAGLFGHAVRLFTLTLEISVSMSHYPSRRVAERSFEHRTLGLGYANIGALLMRAGIAYDSPQGLAVMGAITALMHDTAYATSAEMAAASGACIAYKANKASMDKVIRNHARAAYGTRLKESGLDGYEDLTVVPMLLDHRVLARTPFGNLSDAIIAAAEKMLAGIDGPGYRNMQVTVLAPTGTIGLQMDCDTTGIEPDFALIKYKKLAGGGYLKIVNRSVEPALRALGYTETQIRAIITHALGTATLTGASPVNRESLAAKGLTSAAIDKAEASLGTAVDVRMAFARYVIGDAELQASGIDPALFDTDGFDLLEHLGFTQRQIVDSSDVICGHQTVEGAPGLRDEHLPVFDTANRCGDGTRFIAWQGHVRALGAVAAHLSGSASKTVNLPNEATEDDIRDAYEMSYDLGVKCCAVYRDGSKLSQVLSSAKEKAADEETAADLTEATAAVDAMVRAIVPGESPSAHYQGAVVPKFKLDSERLSRTWKFTVGTQEVYLIAGEYADGTLGEIWITLGGGKEGTLTSAVMHCFAQSISMGLQYGVPLERFVDMFLWHSFAPQGMVQGHKNLKMASSIIDAIFKVLAFHYLGRTDVVQVAEPAPRRAVLVAAGEQPAPAVVPVAATVVVENPVPVAAPAAAGPATGESCTNCGGSMVKSGTCSRCLNCGETSGCS